MPPGTLCKKTMQNTKVHTQSCLLQMMQRHPTPDSHNGWEKAAMHLYRGLSTVVTAGQAKSSFYILCFYGPHPQKLYKNYFYTSRRTHASVKISFPPSYRIPECPCLSTTPYLRDLAFICFVSFARSGPSLTIFRLAFIFTLISGESGAAPCLLK